MASPGDKLVNKDRDGLLKRATTKRRRRPAASGDKNNKKKKPAFQEFDFRSDSLPSGKKAKNPKRKRSSSSSLPILLFQRELGLSRSRLQPWQESMISQQSIKTPAAKWRPYAYRVFSFRQLRTPAQDAILGIDRTGAYSIALGGQRNDFEDEADGEADSAYLEENPPLVFRFYGLPSKSKLRGICIRRRPGLQPTQDAISPLLMTIPLSFIQEDEMGEYGYMNLPAFLPVSTLFSDDNTIGVAKVSSTQQGERNIVLNVFPLPRLVRAGCQNIAVRSLDLGRHNGDPIRYTLLQSGFLPQCTGSTSPLRYDRPTWDVQYEVPAKVLLLQVGNDMFRFVWMQVEQAWEIPCAMKRRIGKPKRPSSWISPQADIVRLVEGDDPQWETKVCNSFTGATSQTSIGASDKNDMVTQGEARIMFEVCFSLRDFVFDLQSQFPEYLEKCRVHDFEPQFLKPQRGCRCFEILLGWQSKTTRWVGAFILVDLASRDYQVLKWVIQPSSEHCVDVKDWIGRLASHRNASHHVFEGDSRINGKKAWYFLEETNENAQPGWKLKESYAKKDAGKGGRTIDHVDNSMVLAESPVFAFEHSQTPVSIRYTVPSTHSS